MSLAQILEVQAHWYADLARFRELHGDPRVLRCDNASVNVSRRAMAFRTAKNIRTETICPYESHRNGTAERMNSTLIEGASTVLIYSGLGKQWWFHAVRYQAYLHNIRYSSTTKSSPRVLMFNTKPDVSHLQEFGVEGWLHLRKDQRSDTKFDARGEQIIFVSYPPNQQGFLVWSPGTPGRGPAKVVVTNNVVFGSRCPRSTRSPVELISETSTELFLEELPSQLTFPELQSAVDLRIIGTFEANLILTASSFPGLRSMLPSQFPRVLKYTQEHNLCEVHLSLADSSYLAAQPLDDRIFPH